MEDAKHTLFLWNYEVGSADGTMMVTMLTLNTLTVVEV